MLLIFAAVGVGFVLFTQKSAENQREEEAKEEALASNLSTQIIDQKPFEIDSTKLTQDGDENWLLELKVRYRNEAETALKLDSAAAVLETDSGTQVPEFFLPFSPTSEIPAKAEEFVDLRYWLDSQHHGQDLWLSILGERVKVSVEQ